MKNVIRTLQRIVARILEVEARTSLQDRSAFPRK